MKVLIEGLLPRMFPGLPFFCIEHEGKSDLEKSIPRKLKAWREPGVIFAVVQDNDNGDCSALKRRLKRRCRESGRDDTLIRIVCQELEAWYIGEPEAMAAAFADAKLRRIASQPRYRNPDEITNPSSVVKRLVPSFQKTAGARLMANHLTREENRSASFAAFLNGVERLGKQVGATASSAANASLTENRPNDQVPRQLPLV